MPLRVRHPDGRPGCSVRLAATARLSRKRFRDTPADRFGAALPTSAGSRRQRGEPPLSCGKTERDKHLRPQWMCPDGRAPWTARKIAAYRAAV